MAAPLTQEELDAMRQDIEDNKLLTGLSGEEQARLVLQNALPEAARSLVQLALHADKESVRMQSTIHILDRGLGRVQDNPPTPVEDPWTTLMQECARQVISPEDYPELVEPEVIVPGSLPKLSNKDAQDFDKLEEVTRLLRAADNPGVADFMPPNVDEATVDKPEGLWTPDSHEGH